MGSVRGSGVMRRLLGVERNVDEQAIHHERAEADKQQWHQHAAEQEPERHIPEFELFGMKYAVPYQATK
jgi:hypothetical protein